jgi:hypothetical protein
VRSVSDILADLGPKLWGLEMSTVSNGQGSEAEDEKVCPYCAETIKIAAIKCKHCGEFVNESCSADQLPPIADAGVASDFSASLRRPQNLGIGDWDLGSWIAGGLAENKKEFPKKVRKRIRSRGPSANYFSEALLLLALNDDAEELFPTNHALNDAPMKAAMAALAEKYADLASNEIVDAVVLASNCRGPSPQAFPYRDEFFNHLVEGLPPVDQRDAFSIMPREIVYLGSLARHVFWARELVASGTFG